MDLERILDIIRNSKELKKCPACGSSYKAGEIDFLGQFESAYLIQFKCRDCDLPVIATLIVKETVRKSKVAANKRIIKFKKEISLDDIIYLYQGLKNFDGDFEAVLRKTNSRE